MMEEWSDYQTEQASEKRRLWRDLWQTLAEDHEVPEAEVLERLSGLIGGEIEDFTSRWNELDHRLRRTLIATLHDLATDDFQLDFSAVFRIGLKDADPQVRAVSVAGLREIADVRLVATYVKMLRHDPAPIAREAAAAGLAEYVLLGELGKIRQEPFETAVIALRESYLDEGEQAAVRCQALEAIAYTGTGGVTELIRDAYQAEDEQMRISAVIAMGRSADENWSVIVRRELGSTNPKMRLKATRASGELQLREAVTEIVELTDDVAQPIRLAAVWALGQIGGKVAEKALRFLLESELDDSEMQNAAREALQELEFFHGDPASFFGPPTRYDGETEESWGLDELLSDFGDEDDDDVEWV